jgi:riboflavin kinase/FMN adenylyltransferase
MQHYWSIEDVYLQDSWLTIGSFDGVHKGHQQILRDMTAGAHQANSTAVVLTFHPHPAVVLGKRSDPFYLTSPEERASLLAQLGVDILLTCPFNLHVARTSANDFMHELSKHLHMNQLWVGYDFALGKNREGDVPTLKHLGQTLGYEVHAIHPVKLQGEIISSSAIRAALGNGNVAKASELLGRPYQVSGEIVHGDGRGRSIGIPRPTLRYGQSEQSQKWGCTFVRLMFTEKQLGQ